MAKARSPGKTVTRPEPTIQNLDQVLDIIRIMGENEIAELDLDVPGLKLSLKKQEAFDQPSVVINPAQFHSIPVEAVPSMIQPSGLEKKAPIRVVKEPEPAKPLENRNHHKILSPMAGTFYRAPSPTSLPYVEEGQKVSAGQPICIVEAMKLMNEIKTDKAGIVVKVLMENAKPVEKGTELFIVELGG